MNDLSRREFVVTSVAAAMSTMLPAKALAMGQPGGQERKVIDAWGHVSLPRFFSADDFIQILDSNHAEAAVVGTAMTCPDLTELSHAIMKYPDRLRPSVWLWERRRRNGELYHGAIRGRFHRHSAACPLIPKEPAILDLVGKYGQAAYVEGSDGYQVATRVLLNFIDKYPKRSLRNSFSRPTDTAIFGKDDLVRQLFRHPVH